MREDVAQTAALGDEAIASGVIGDCGYGATRDVLGRPDALYFLRTIGGCSQLCALSRAGGWPRSAA